MKDCFNEINLEIMKNAFCFILSSLRSQDTYIFVLTFWSSMKNDLIRKMRIISKFMTSQRG